MPRGDRLVSVVVSRRGPGLAFVVHVGSGRSRIRVVVRVTRDVKEGLVVPHGPHSIMDLSVTFRRIGKFESFGVVRSYASHRRS